MSIKSFFHIFHFFYITVVTGLSQSPVISGSDHFSKLQIHHSSSSFFFRAAPTAYGDSQARGPIRATAAGLHHRHRNEGSEPHLWPTPQLPATPDAPPIEWGQGSNLHFRGYQLDLFLLSRNRTSLSLFFFKQNSNWKCQNVTSIKMQFYGHLWSVQVLCQILHLEQV